MKLSGETSREWDSLFLYDESSPSCLIWNPNRDYKGKRNSRNGKPAGTKAIGIRQKYYRVPVKIGKKHKRIMVHRIIWEMFNFTIPKGFEIDHINGDSLDNRIENLRCVPVIVNKRNRKIQNNSKQGKSGISVTTNGQGRTYATASWHWMGKHYQKRYSIDDLGEEIAMKYAKEFRMNKIEELNQQGAGYTDRHGQ